MKSLCIFLLLLLSNGLWAKEVRRPAFIVEGEPIPPGFILSYKQPLRTKADAYKTLFFDAAPLVINRSDRFQFFGMLGVMADFYGSDLGVTAGGAQPVPPNYLGSYLAINLSGALGNNFFYQSYHSVGGFAAKAQLDSRDAFKYFQLTTIGKKWMPTFQTSLGLLSTTRHGDLLLIPLLKATYAHPKFVVDAIVPVSLKFRYLHSADFHVESYYSGATTGFATNNRYRAVQRVSNEIGVNAERRIKGWFWFKVGALVATKTSFTSINDGYEAVLEESPTHLKALVELFVRPD